MKVQVLSGLSTAGEPETSKFSTENYACPAKPVPRKNWYLHTIHMISKYTYKKLTWLDLECPTRDEVLTLVEAYDIHPLVGEELVSQTERAKVDLHPNALYLVLHFPVLDRSAQTVKIVEVDFVIGKDFLITTHYDSIDPLHEFAKMFEVHSILDQSMVAKHAGFLFFFIIKELYKHSLLELERIEDEIQAIEKHIFSGDQKNMVRRISNINRILIDFREAIRFHGETTKSFELAGKQFFGDDFSYYLSAITGEYKRVESIFHDQKQVLNDLRKTNDALLANRTNETIKVLTILSFITFPLSLLAGLLAMITHVTIITTTKGYFMIIGALIVLVIIMVIHFKNRRWL